MLNTHSKVVSQSRKFYDSLEVILNENFEDGENKLELLNKIKDFLEETVKNEFLVEEAKKIIQPIQERSVSNKEIDSSQLQKEFDSITTDTSDTVLEEVWDGDDQLNKLKESISSISGSQDMDEKYEDEGDEEITATQQEKNFIDPISKKLMENPVRHILCGHVYDRDSTLQMIKTMRRKGFRCPYVGCNYRKAINAEDLEEAKDFKRQIERRKQAGTYYS